MLVLLFVAFATMKQLQCHTKGHEQNYLELYTSPYDTSESGCLLSRTPSWMAFRELWMTLRFLLSLIFCQGCPIQMSVKEVTKLVPGLNFSVLSFEMRTQLSTFCRTQDIKKKAQRYVYPSPSTGSLVMLPSTCLLQLRYG